MTASLTRSKPRLVGWDSVWSMWESSANYLLEEDPEWRDDVYWDDVNDSIVDAEERLAEGRGPSDGGRPEWIAQLYELLEQRPREAPKLTLIEGGTGAVS